MLSHTDFYKSLDDDLLENIVKSAISEVVWVNYCFLVIMLFFSLVAPLSAQFVEVFPDFLWIYQRTINVYDVYCNSLLLNE